MFDIAQVIHGDYMDNILYSENKSITYTANNHAFLLIITNLRLVSMCHASTYNDLHWGLACMDEGPVPLWCSSAINTDMSNC